VNSWRAGRPPGEFAAVVSSRPFFIETRSGGVDAREEFGATDGQRTVLAFGLGDVHEADAVLELEGH